MTGFRLAVDDADRLAVLQVEIGGVDTDDAAAKDDDIEIVAGDVVSCLGHGSGPSDRRARASADVSRAPSVIGLRASSSGIIAENDFHRRRKPCGLHSSEVEVLMNGSFAREIPGRLLLRRQRSSCYTFASVS